MILFTLGVLTGCIATVALILFALACIEVPKGGHRDRKGW